MAEARIAEAGIAIGDFQYFVTPDGRAVIIDAGGACLETDPQFPRDLLTMIGEVRRVNSRVWRAFAEPRPA